MAKIFLIPVAHFVTLSILVSVLTFPAAGETHRFVKSVNRVKLGLRKEKLSHFKLYWHDVISGPRPTVATIVQPVNGSTTGFGSINMIDDALTEGPKLSSKLIGRAQGFYALASQEEFGLLMAMNFAFSEGKYNGSTITILGRNTVFSAVREMPIIGGSGLFRFARGYVEARTHSFDIKKGDATVDDRDLSPEVRACPVDHLDGVGHAASWVPLRTIQYAPLHGLGYIAAKAKPPPPPPPSDH
ncbi:hypothetical protein LguiA_021825 [Lonicera macranthoides]